MEHRKVSVMTRKYQPGNAECIHKTALGLFRSGVIDEKRMKEFDDMCLEPESKSESKKVSSKQVSGLSTRRVSAGKAKSKIRAVA